MGEKKSHSEQVYTNLDRLVALKYDIRGFSFLPKQPVQSLLTGKHRSRLRGRGLDFEEVRAYNFGDDIRSIDWKVTARTKKAHTKVYSEERERPVFIVVDQSPSMFFGSRNYMKSVIAAEAAALSAWKVLAVGDRVGGLVLDGESVEVIKPQRNAKSVMQFLKLIVEKNNKLNTSSYNSKSEYYLDQVMEQILRYVTHDFLVIVISDFYEADPRINKTFKQISRHNDIIAAVIKDEMEYKPGAGMIIGDGDQQINLADLNMDKAAEFSKKQDENIIDFKETMFKYGITTFELNTVEPAVTQIRNLIGGGRHG